MDLHNPDEFDELLRQRIACGWSKDRSDVEAWRDAADEGTMSPFWITTATTTTTTSADDGSNAGPAVGHIALVSAARPPDLELANPDKSVLMISTLFVMPAHRGGGLARAAVRVVEGLARTEPYGSPACRAVTLHTLSRRYSEDDGEDWRGIFERMGQEPPPKGPSVEDWYARMGYVKWKEEPRYHDKLLDGTEVMLIASFLRKDLC